MTTSTFATAPLDDRQGFLLVHEVFCDGPIPAEWDGDNRPVLYDTQAEAEIERVDAAEMRTDGMRDAHIEPEDDDRWVEAAVLHPDGSLTLVDQGRTFTAKELRELLR